MLSNVEPLHYKNTTFEHMLLTTISIKQEQSPQQNFKCHSSLQTRRYFWKWSPFYCASKYTVQRVIILLTVTLLSFSVPIRPRKPGSAPYPNSPLHTTSLQGNSSSYLYSTCTVYKTLSQLLFHLIFAHTHARTKLQERSVNT